MNNSSDHGRINSERLIFEVVHRKGLHSTDWAQLEITSEDAPMISDLLNPFTCPYH